MELHKCSAGWKINFASSYRNLLNGVEQQEENIGNTVIAGIKSFL